MSWESGTSLDVPKCISVSECTLTMFDVCLVWPLEEFVSPSRCWGASRPFSAAYVEAQLQVSRVTFRTMMDDGHGWTLEHLRTRLRFLMKCLGCLWALQFHVAGFLYWLWRSRLGHTLDKTPVRKAFRLIYLRCYPKIRFLRWLLSFAIMIAEYMPLDSMIKYSI